MLLDVCDKTKIAYFWLSQEERNNEEFYESLRPQYREWKNKGYVVCVFVSGKESLVENTKELLVHNKMVLAKKNLRERDREAR
ncbi:MAG: hypothetical protein IKB88_09685 [Clostridia bacterium]|nr:hypothetical protein [Clostridia bacterium]